MVNDQVKFYEREGAFSLLFSGEVPSVKILAEDGEVFEVTSQEFREICTLIQNGNTPSENAEACDEGGLCNRWFRLSDAWLNFLKSKPPIMTGVMSELSSHEVTEHAEFLMSESGVLKIFIKDRSDYDEESDMFWDGGVYELSRETLFGFFEGEVLSMLKEGRSPLSELFFEDVVAQTKFAEWLRNAKPILQIDQICL